MLTIIELMVRAWQRKSLKEYGAIAVAATIAIALFFWRENDIDSIQD